jgi:hypothetical protein
VITSAAAEVPATTPKRLATGHRPQIPLKIPATHITVAVLSMLDAWVADRMPDAPERMTRSCAPW